MAAQTEYYQEEEEERTPVRAVVADALPRGDASIVPANSISGARAARRDRHHDVPGLADARRRRAGALGGGRMAVGGRARDHHPDPARPISDSRRTCAMPWRWHRPRRGFRRRAPYSKEESASLLEPWLGKGLALDELPVPRMIVVRIACRARRRTLRRCASSSPRRCRARRFDDHRGWIDRMRAMARSAVAARAWPSSRWCSPPPCCR